MRNLNKLWMASLIVLMMIVLVGCGQRKNNRKSGETHHGEEASTLEREEKIMDKNAKMLMLSDDIDEDGAWGAWDQLKKEGADNLVSAKLMSEKNGILVLAKDKNGTKWYIAFGALGNLECIYKGSLEGEPVYAAID